MSNPLMKSSPNAGGWLEGNSCNRNNQAPVVSKDLRQLYDMYQAAKVNATPEVYGELARDWIEDDDAVKAKAAAYYEYVVAHD